MYSQVHGAQAQPGKLVHHLQAPRARHSSKRGAKRKYNAQEGRTREKRPSLGSPRCLGGRGCESRTHASLESCVVSGQITNGFPNLNQHINEHISRKRPNKPKGTSNLKSRETTQTNIAQAEATQEAPRAWCELTRWWSGVFSLRALNLASEVKCAVVNA